MLFPSSPFSEDRFEDAENHEHDRQEIEDPEVVADVGQRQGHPLETESR
jgi:hypothetical protein